MPLWAAIARSACSASTLAEPAALASSRARRRMAAARAGSFLAISPPRYDADAVESLGVLLVHRLAGDPEGFRHLRPAPTGPEGPLHLGVLEPVGEAAQRDDRREPIAGLSRSVKVGLDHAATVVDRRVGVNLGCSSARSRAETTSDNVSEMLQKLAPSSGEIRRCTIVFLQDRWGGSHG